MYAELVFTENIAVADDLMDIALYEVIPRDQELRRAEKYVAELEVITTVNLAVIMHTTYMQHNLWLLYIPFCRATLFLLWFFR